MIGRPWSWRAPALGLALALALAGAWAGTRAARQGPRDLGPRSPGPPPLRLEPGVERAYRLEVRSDGRLGAAGEAGGAGRGAFSLEVRGLLVLRPYPSTGEPLEVGARLVGAELTVDGRTQPAADGLDAPFSFRLDRHGRFTGLRFGPSLPPGTAALLEQLLVRLALVLPRERQATWRVRERDAAGIYRAVYRVDPATPNAVEKRKLEYLPAEGEPPPQVVESRSTFELDPERGVVRRVEGAEVLRRRAGPLQGQEAVSFLYVLTTSPDLLPATLAELARARDEARGPVDGAAAPAPPGLPAARSAGEILDRFARGFRTDRAAAEGLVAAWLRQAGAPGELLRRLDAMAADPERAALDAPERSVLWRLLAQEGTPEAEAALLDAAVSHDHPPLTRRQAIGHFGQVTEARPAMVDGLLGVYDTGHGAARPDPDAEALGAMALLAAGSLGHPDLAAPALTRAVVEALTERLAGAEDRGTREAVLAAMGNVGEPALPALRAALADPDPTLRAAAVGAFRRMDGPEGRRALLAHATAEPDPMVRARAIETLQRLAPDREVLAWAAGEATRAQDRGVLLALVDLLGGAGGRSPEAKAALQEILRRAEDRAVAMRVLRYVPPEGPPRGARPPGG